MKGTSIVTGKRGEYMVIGKILEKGFTVYTPVADVEGIDCIIRNEKGRLIQIQIKTRNKNQEEGRYFIVKEFRPNYDFFICCYLIDTDELWVIPSHIFHDLSYYDKKIKDRTLPMSLTNQKILSKYKDNLGLELLKKGNRYD
jgi:hypothetical protein